MKLFVRLVPSLVMLLALAPAGARADEAAASAVEPLLDAVAPATAVPPAGWVAFASGGPHALEGPAVTVARGAQVAIVRVGEGTWLAVHREQGVLGRLAVPAETVWLGLDTEDRPWVATASGRLYGASDVAAAQREDAFVRVADVAGAVAWDLTPTAIYACTADALVRLEVTNGEAAPPATLPVSLSDGTTLAACEQVFARADGAVVLVGLARVPQLADELPGANRDTTPAEPEPATWISTDGGKRWRSEPRSPGARLERDGQWIWNGDPEAPRVLATDGTWTATVDRYALSEPSVPEAHVAFGDEPRGHHLPWRLGLMTPASPPQPAAMDSESPPEPLELGSDPGQSYLFGRLGCSGIACVERFNPVHANRRARYTFGFFADGSCAAPAAEPVEPAAPPPAKKSKGKTPAPAAPPAYVPPPLPDTPCTVSQMKRLPRLGMLDRQLGRLDFVSLPDSCDAPLEVQSAGGLGLLFCAAERDDRVRVFVRTPESRWADEGLLPRAVIAVDPPSPEMPYLPAPQPVVADDGTLLLERPGCGAWSDDACPAWMRRPLEPGSPGAWSEVVPDGRTAAGYRVLDAGRVLLLSGGADGGSFEVLLADGGAQPRRVAGPIAVGEASLYDLRVDDSCLAVELGRGEAQQRRWQVIGAQGTLLESSSCEEARAEHARMLRQGWLRVRCNLPEATVIVSGEGFAAERLRCPLDVGVDPGVYEVTVAAVDHDPYRGAVEVPERGEAVVEAELLAIPFVDVRALGGVAIGGGSELTVPLFVAEIAFSLGDNQYEIGPFFRLGIASDDPDRDHGLYGGAFGRAVWHFDAWDVGVGGSVGFGSMLGKEPGGKQTTDSVYTLRYAFDAIGGMRLGIVNLRAVLHFYPSDPYTFEAIGGLGIGF